MIKEERDNLLKLLKDVKEVLGGAIGEEKNGEEYITLYLENGSVLNKIPKIFNGFKVKTQITGKIKAL